MKKFVCRKQADGKMKYTGGEIKCEVGVFRKSKKVGLRNLALSSLTLH